MRLISFQPVVCVPEITRCPGFRCEMVPVTNNAMIMKSWKTLIVLNIFFRSTIFIILFFVLTSFYMNQNYRTDLKHYANVVGIYLNSKYTTVFSVLVTAGTIFLCVKKPSIIGLVRLLFQVRLLLDLKK